MSENKYKENIRLVALSQAGDERATEELFRINGGLVNSIASRFCGRGTDIEDLVELGNIGLLTAIRSLQQTRKCLKTA